MRLRLFGTGTTAPEAALEIQSDYLPATGDLLALEYGGSVRTLVRVVDRMFRIYAIPGTLQVVDLEVEPVEPNAAAQWRRG